MRWEDKPRKKTPKEIVLEYIKFLKLMNLYGKFRYKWWEKPCIEYSEWFSTPIINEKYYRSINRLMIDWYVQRFGYYGTRIFDRNRMCAIFQLNNYSVITDLLWLHFKDKHIANCIITEE